MVTKTFLVLPNSKPFVTNTLYPSLAACIYRQTRKHLGRIRKID